MENKIKGAGNLEEQKELSKKKERKKESFVII
jgi:hypothetical protein